MVAILVPAQYLGPVDFDALVQLPEAHRDELWETRFLAAIPEICVEIPKPEPVTGPDGWPYLQVRTGPNGTEPVVKIIDWLAARGIGMVVNAHKMVPDYVFPYGMLWPFRGNRRFAGASGRSTPSDRAFDPGAGLVAGPPSQAYLPTFVREVIREFLKSQGFEDPRIVVITNPDYTATDLAFSIESLGHMAPSDQSVLAEALLWFLPPSYNLTFLAERDVGGFVSL